MGIRTAVIVASVCGPFVAGGTAVAQSPAAGAGSSQSPTVSTPPPAGKATKRQPATSEQPNAVPGVVIVTRPPVRREVEAQPRRVVKRDQPKSEAATAPSGGASAGAAAQPAPQTSTQSTTQAASPPAAPPTGPQKTWPLVVGAGAAAAAGTVAGSATGAQPAPARPDQWSEAEIKQARMHCDAILKGVDAVITPEDPIKEGECGSPVVYRLSSISKSPAVEISPPVVLTCDMVATLDKWVRREVQPSARALIGGPIVKIDTMSSYSCRNAYGRTKTRLSEHGKANAIDISSFATARDTVTVLAGWGPTERELKAIAAKKEAERAAAAAAAQSGAKAPLTQLPQPAQPAPQPNPGMLTGVPGVVVPAPGTSPGTQPSFGLAPTRLGGPNAKDQRQSAPPALPSAPASADPKSKFLKQIHAAACRHFGTVLGPEANNAHKNHFHLDMAQRNRGSFCE